jgi:hypothetical protein
MFTVGLMYVAQLYHFEKQILQAAIDSYVALCEINIYIAQ